MALVLRTPRPTLFPYTTLFRSDGYNVIGAWDELNKLKLKDIGQARNRLIELLAEYKAFTRSEEHTSELQSRGHIVCRLLLEKKKITHIVATNVMRSKQIQFRPS